MSDEKKSICRYRVGFGDVWVRQDARASAVQRARHIRLHIGIFSNTMIDRPQSLSHLPFIDRRFIARTAYKTPMVAAAAMRKLTAVRRSWCDIYFCSKDLQVIATPANTAIGSKKTSTRRIAADDFFELFSIVLHQKKSILQQLGYYTQECNVCI